MVIPEEPSSILEAFRFPEWRKAIQLEFDALLSTNTWTLVPHAFNHNLVDCKWIFKTNHLLDRTIERYKARLVAKGYNQIAGMDYS